MRTHYCGEVTEKFIGETVEICGWVNRRRDHGGVIFIDLRDRSGLVQVVYDPDIEDVFKMAEQVRNEFVLKITGLVRARPEGTTNDQLSSGQIEILGKQLEILNKADTPPFQIDEDEVSEDIRLRYRYVDLRRPIMQERMMLRSKVSRLLRNYLDDNGFMDMETPMLTRATPEGARDYLVPSRTHAGKFFALPQSPQLFKQLLMMSGMDRYYQIVRCFRDEDLRADRQPEFTQIDMELSFIEEEDIYEIVEGMMLKLFKDVLDIELSTPFARMGYEEAMARFGTDRPDTRFGLELVNLTETTRDCGFNVFQSVVKKGGLVKSINAKGSGDLSRKDLDDLTGYVGQFGAKGLAWVKVKSGGEWQSPITKFFTDGEREAIS